MSEQPPLLSVEDLTVEFPGEDGVARAVDRVSFSIQPGETLGLVGESGCGKSVTSLAILGILDSPGRIGSGRILFRGEDLPRATPERLRAIRGAGIAMIFQEPMTSLNPVFTIGNQIIEAIRAHEPIPLRQAWVRSVETLGRVGIPNPELRMKQYPHELSGGMKQRAMIAMALVCQPQLLICDEPTTALDVTIQAQILELLRTLQRDTGMSMLFITHDLGVVAELANRVCVMYCGRIVESAACAPLYRAPLHPYTIGLFKSIPAIAGKGDTLYTIRGMVPHPLDRPAGCPFHPRCERATGLCQQDAPALEEKSPAHRCACHYATINRETA